MTNCARCGQQHPGCAGHRSGDGQPCGRRPVIGATVCFTHGGSAPQVKRAAAERTATLEAEHRARRVVASWDDQQDTALSPVEVLARVMTVTYRQAALHRAQLAQLADDDRDPYVRRGKDGREYPSPLALLEQAERRLAADMPGEPARDRRRPSVAVRGQGSIALVGLGGLLLARRAPCVARCGLDRAAPRPRWAARHASRGATP